MRHVAAFFLSVVFTYTAVAAPADDQSVVTFLEVTKAAKTLDAYFLNLERHVRQSMPSKALGQNLSPEQQRLVDEATEKFVATLRNEMSWEKMRPLFVQAYKETFTQKEITSLIAFFKTPAGSAYVEKTPLLMQKSVALMQPRTTAILERLAQEMQQTLSELEASR